MLRRALALALLALLPARPATAQSSIFAAPSTSNVTGSIEQSGAAQQLHLLSVTNRSSVPIVVFGVVLTSCENVRQWCDGRRENISIPAGARRVVGRVEPRNPDQSFTYRWTFSYHADSTNAAFIAVMREHGLLAETPPRAAPDSLASITTAPVPTEGADESRAAAAVAEQREPDLSPLVLSSQVDGIATATSAVAPTRQFFVTNRSAYPIVVYSFNLATCLNVKQVCGRIPVNVPVPAGRRVPVARVDAQDRAKRYSYDWTYDWRVDTTDAKVAAALRARGLREGSLGEARNLAVQPEAPPPARMTASVKEHFRFRVARESILGATPSGLPVPATGACIDPVELARHQRDSSIALQAVVPPRLTPAGINLPMLPSSLRDSAKGPVQVLARWAVDTTGATIPGSAAVLESPYGLVSVGACGAILGARLTPARDAAGRPVRTWVEAPLLIRR